MMCAGMMDMIRAAMPPANQEWYTSTVSSPTSTLAMEPNQAGTNTHTSFRLMRTLPRPRV